MMPTNTILTEVAAARRISTPLVAIQTPDSSETESLLIESGALRVPRSDGGFDDAPLLRWTVNSGIEPITAGGVEALEAAVAGMGDGYDPISSSNPVEALLLADKLPAGSVLILHHYHLMVRDSSGAAAPGVVSALLDLRDTNKVAGRLTILTGVRFDLPTELSGSVLVIDEPLPGDDQIRTLVSAQYDNAGLAAPADDELDRAVDALSGLPSAFTVEQATARTLSSDGLDTKALWDRKRRLISETKGLTVWDGGETFDMIKGYDNVKTKLGRVNRGKRGVNGIVFIDEIEKALSGSSGAVADSSGTSQDQLGVLLEWMADEDASGLLFVGHPGTSKSVIAKAAGTDAGVPTIKLDLGALKGSLVGESEGNVRAAIKTINAVSRGKALVIATSNNIAALPPELLRRFRKGIYFFDLPTKAEREKIWSLYLSKAGLDPAAVVFPDDRDWTGAEIETCVDTAWDEGISLEEAALSIVPVAVANPEKVEALRRLASGSYISASSPGVYRWTPKAPAAPRRGVRKIASATKLN